MFLYPFWCCWIESLWVILCWLWQLDVFWLSPLPLWSCWLHSWWVVSQVQLGTFWLSWQSHIGPICFTDCEWFNIRFSWVPSDCPYSHFGHAGLIDGEWFQAKSSYGTFDYSYSHSGLVGLTGSECHIHARFSSVSSDHSYSNSGPIGLIDGEWFHERFNWVSSDYYPHTHFGLVGLKRVSNDMPSIDDWLLTVLAPTLVVLTWSELVISCQVN